MASYISQVSIGGTIYPVGSSLYGIESSTSGAGRVITLENFDTLTTGVTVFVKFTRSCNYSEDVTLKIGGTAAKPIAIPEINVASTKPELWAENEIVGFTYDGTSWVMLGKTVYSDWTSGEVTSNNFINSVSTLSTAGKVISLAVLAKAIDAKINALNVSSISGTGAGKTLASLSETDGKIAATFQDISITKSQVSDLGTIGQAAEKNVDTFISAGTTSTNLPTSAAVAGFVEDAVAGLTGAMHLIGTTTTELIDGDTTASVTIDGQTVTPQSGDVVLYAGKEFVWDGTSWELLGDEGSYALKTSTTQVGSASGWNAGKATTLTKTDVSIPNVTSVGTAPTLTKSDVSIPNITNAGSATTASVASGTLTITNGSAPTLGTAISATHIDSWSAGSATTLGTAISATHIDSYTAGSAPALTITPTTVVKP